MCSHTGTTSKHIRRIALVITAITITGTISKNTAFAKTNTAFTDVTGKPEITWCVNQGILNGYADNTFRPNGEVSKATFQKVLARTFEMKDLKATQDETPITRYETTAMLQDIINNAGLTPDTYDRKAAEQDIKDFNTIPEKYKTAVADVYALDILRGASDGKFHGERNITRAQAAVIIYRTAHAITSDNIAMTANPSLTNGKEITKKNVSEMLAELKTLYPSNKDWPGYSKTTSKKQADRNSIRDIIESYEITGSDNAKCSTDTGCGGWAAFVCDYIFGQNANFHKIELNEIHPGDLMLKLDSANRLTHVQIYSGPVGGQKASQSVRITNANNGLGVPTEAGTTAYKVNWTSAMTGTTKFDIYTAYPE